MIWEPGTELSNGQYQIEDILSRNGNFGMTYRAKHLVLGKVVIKAPHDHHQSDPNYGDFVTCFIKEAETLAKLALRQQPPNIVRVQDFFYENNVPCMVMNYVEGETLDDLVIRSGAIPEATIVPWIVTMAEALGKVHELGLVHRDANPANIVINLDNQPILIDFGIALHIQPRPSTSMAAFAGHKTFAPLEQLEPDDDQPDRAVSRDPKLDIYCLAATLYYAITGTDPKGANARQNRFNSRGKDALIPPQTLKLEISDRIQHTILAGMAMYPDDRPASMAEWITLLTTNAGLRSAIGAPTLESLPLQRLEFTTIELNKIGEVIAKPQKSAEYVDEILNETGLLLRMMIIPGGSFMMGSPEDELHSYNDERPQHLVNVPDFAIGQLTVTQAQWKAIAALPKVKRLLNQSPSNFSGDDRPVERVNWDEAVEFCDRLTFLSQKIYHLPSEAEWEYACRAGTSSPFHFGPTIVTDFANYRGLDEDRGENGILLGNYGDGPKGKYRGQTIDPNEFPPNAFGLHNMHGNVWEWCADNWHKNYKDAPIDGSPWLDQDADANSGRVIRGGSWSFSPQNCRSAFRNFGAPDDRNYNIGFRVMFRLRP